MHVQTTLQRTAVKQVERGGVRRVRCVAHASLHAQAAACAALFHQRHFGWSRLPSSRCVVRHVQASARSFTSCPSSISFAFMGRSCARCVSQCRTLGNYGQLYMGGGGVQQKCGQFWQLSSRTRARPLSAVQRQQQLQRAACRKVDLRQIMCVGGCPLSRMFMVCRRWVAGWVDRQGWREVCLAAFKACAHTPHDCFALLGVHKHDLGSGLT